MTANRDLANEIYDPLVSTRAVLSASIPESAPTLATDGTACNGWNLLRVTTRSVGTTHRYEVWLYTGTGWVQIQDTNDFAAGDFDAAADSSKVYVCSGATRYKTVYTGGDADMASDENLSV